MSPTKQSLVKELTNEELNTIYCQQQTLSMENMIMSPTTIYAYICSLFHYQNTHLKQTHC